MQLLLFFLLGVIFCECIQPILDQITGLICSVLEWRKGVYSYKVQKINADIQKIEYPKDVEYPMGFQVDPVEYEDEDEEDE